MKNKHRIVAKLKRALELGLIFIVSVFIALGLVRLSVPIGEPRVLEDWGPRPKLHFPSNRTKVPNVETSLQRSCRSGYEWACRRLTEGDPRGYRDRQARLVHQCNMGRSCACVRAGEWLDGVHAHDRAAQAFTQGCDAGSGYACAQAGARWLTHDARRGLSMLERSCDLEPANEGCRYLGEYLIAHGMPRGRAALEAGCDAGDGRACLAVSEYGGGLERTLRDRAKALLQETCGRRANILGPQCGATSETVRFGACGALAQLELSNPDDGTRRARAIVTRVARQCDAEEDRTCDLSEFLPHDLIMNRRWESWCKSGDAIACRIAEHEQRARWPLREDSYGAAGLDGPSCAQFRRRVP